MRTLFVYNFFVCLLLAIQVQAGPPPPPPCQPGQVLSGSTCVACATGSYCPDGANQYPCRAGQYSNSQGATSCLDCDSGWWSNQGATGCQECPAGTQSIGSGCVNCAPGSYGDVAGLGLCKKCLSGTYQANYGATGCNTCSVGSYSGVTATSCVSCQAGYYFDGSYSCLVCPAGNYCVVYDQYNNAYGSATPSACPPGTVQNQQGQTTCYLCNKGNYPNSGSTDCLACPSGTTTCALVGGGKSISDCVASC